MGYISTVDRGRSHIAFGRDYQGSTNSYNTGFTRFFARMFRKTMDVTIGNKNVTVNKKSYMKLLKNAGENVTSKNISAFKTLNLTNPKINSGYMRAHLTERKQTKLFRKMVTAFQTNNDQKGLKQLYKGAAVDKYFWVRDGAVYFKDYRSGLGHYDVAPRKVDEVTPIMAAVVLGKVPVVNELYAFGANATAPGKTFQFSRARVATHDHVSYQPTMDPTLVPTYGYRHGRHGRGRIHHGVGVAYRPGMDVIHRRSETFVDRKTNITEIGIAPNWSIVPVRNLPDEQNTWTSYPRTVSAMHF